MSCFVNVVHGLVMCNHENDIGIFAHVIKLVFTQVFQAVHLLFIMPVR